MTSTALDSATPAASGTASDAATASPAVALTIAGSEATGGAGAG